MQEYALSDTDLLSDSYGFNMAFGLSEFDGSGEYIEDPDYGTMTAATREWGFRSGYGTIINPLATRPCTREDFNLDENLELIGPELITKFTDEMADPKANPFFFPVNNNSLDFVSTYYPKMHCFDERIKL